jgi:hypothetical protein
MARSLQKFCGQGKKLFVRKRPFESIILLLVVIIVIQLHRYTFVQDDLLEVGLSHPDSAVGV